MAYILAFGPPTVLELTNSESGQGRRHPRYGEELQQPELHVPPLQE